MKFTQDKIKSNTKTLQAKEQNIPGELNGFAVTGLEMGGLAVGAVLFVALARGAQRVVHNHRWNRTPAPSDV